MRIVHKLFGAMVITSGIVLLVFAVLIVNTLGRGFIDYLNNRDEQATLELQERLKTEFLSYGNFDRLVHQRGRWRKMVENQPLDMADDFIPFEGKVPQGPPPPLRENRPPPSDNDRPPPPRRNAGPPPEVDGNPDSRQGPPPRRNAGPPPENYGGPDSRQGPPPRRNAGPPPEDYGNPDSRQGPPPRRPPGEARRPPPENGQRPGANKPPPREAEGEPGSLVTRTTLYDANRVPLLGRPERSRAPQPIILEGQTIGYLAVDPVLNITATRDLEFLAGQTKKLFALALALILFATLASILLARHLVSGVSKLARAARKLSAGDSGARVEESGSDEIGMLARDFNHLARTLEANEQARKRWTADISHELRTPLSVLLGETEALRDRVRPVNDENLKSLHEEVLHLSRLVDDLYQLSLSDLGSVTYRMEPQDPAKLTERAADRFRHRFEEAGLSLELGPTVNGAVIKADAQRLSQLLNNLFENSCRYTKSGGRIRINQRLERNHWILTVEDSAPGVTSEQLPKLFDRLWRADKARSRENGGAGLGLALCVNIVKAHNGQINAAASDLGGLAITVSIPLMR